MIFCSARFIGDRLVGTAGLHRWRTDAAHMRPMLGMGVADDVSGRGIGTALMRALIDAADKWLDIRRIELTVFHDNAGRSASTSVTASSAKACSAPLLFATAATSTWSRWRG